MHAYTAGWDKKTKYPVLMDSWVELSVPFGHTIMVSLAEMSQLLISDPGDLGFKLLFSFHNLSAVPEKNEGSNRPGNYGTCGAGRVIIHIIRRVIPREAPPKSHPSSE
nr:hypothetical protein BaRGS_008996 [Batillaria attramentaria]